MPKFIFHRVRNRVALSSNNLPCEVGQSIKPYSESESSGLRSRAGVSGGLEEFDFERARRAGSGAGAEQNLQK